MRSSTATLLLLLFLHQVDAFLGITAPATIVRAFRPSTTSRRAAADANDDDDDDDVASGIAAINVLGTVWSCSHAAPM